MFCLQSILKCLVAPSQALLTIVILWAMVCVFSDQEQRQHTVFLSNDSSQLHLVCFNHRLPQYFTMKTIPLLLKNSSDFSWRPDSVISHVISSFEMELLRKESERAPTEFPHSGSLLSLVDVVFVIEQSGNKIIVNERKWNSLQKSLELLIDLAQNDERANVRFSVITYSVLEPNVHRTVTFNQSNKIKEILSVSSTNITQSTDKLYQQTSLRRNLALIIEILKNCSSIKLRPNSELYMFSLLDLYPNNQGSKSTANRNLFELVSSLISQATTAESRLSLQFVFDADNQLASSILGDPSLSTLYGDCSHFNKASTLNALLKNALGNALEAHFLSNGIILRTLTWTDLARPECARGLIPTFSGHFPMYPTFKNNCHTGFKCPDCFCSPIHGWVNKGSIDESDKSLNDRFPISNTFSASHEDLALATHDNNVSMDVSEEILTIYSESLCHSNVTPTIVGTPKILQWNPNHEITRDIIGRKEPVVLKNTVVNLWAAMKKWNWSYISNNFGVDTLESVKCTDTYLTFDPDRRVPLKLNISLSFITRNMKKEDFFSCIVDSSNCSDQFLGHYYFGSVPDKLKKDLLPDKFLYNTDKDFKANRQFIWVSSSGMITHTHFDQDYNLFVQLVGKKRFTLWSCFQHDLMYTYPRIHPLWHKSQVNYKDVDVRTFPVFTKANAVQIELSPGDMLYVPPYTWHYVETLSPSVSLSTWSHDYSVYDHMNAIYQHDHKFDLIEDSRGEFAIATYYSKSMRTSDIPHCSKKIRLSKTEKKPNIFAIFFCEFLLVGKVTKFQQVNHTYTLL